MSSAIFCAASTSSTGSVVPGTIGTPASFISSRARVLEPIASIAEAGGPMKVMPASSRRCAKAAFSARKPYPGWTASAPDCWITSSSLSTFRYDSAAGPGPSRYASPPRLTCWASRSASE
jgi:hypothetical protein